jgi:hypothetical protein
VWKLHPWVSCSSRGRNSRTWPAILGAELLPYCRWGPMGEVRPGPLDHVYVGGI